MTEYSLPDLMSKEEFYQKYNLSDYVMEALYANLSHDRSGLSATEKAACGPRYQTTIRYFNGSHCTPKVKDLMDRAVEAIVILGKPYNEGRKAHQAGKGSKGTEWIDEVIDIVRKGNVVGVNRKPAKYVATKRKQPITPKHGDEEVPDPYYGAFFIDNPLDRDSDIFIDNIINNNITEERLKEE